MSEQAVFDALKYHIEDSATGTRRYYNNAGQLHRIGGAAVVYADGSKFWIQNDQYHVPTAPPLSIIMGISFGIRTICCIGQMVPPLSIIMGMWSGTSMVRN